jgi:hypothetical protein
MYGGIAMVSDKDPLLPGDYEALWKVWEGRELDTSCAERQNLEPRLDDDLPVGGGNAGHSRSGLVRQYDP